MSAAAFGALRLALDGAEVAVRDAVAVDGARAMTLVFFEDAADARVDRVASRQEVVGFSETAWV